MMKTVQVRRKQRKFGIGAKVLVSSAAAAALVGGWSAIGQLDAAKAESAGQQRAAPTPAPVSAPDSTLLQRMGVGPVPTLEPASSLLAQSGATGAQSSSTFKLPDMPALQPLQPLSQLPSMPSVQMPAGGFFGGGGRVSRGS